jgi:hypothetical protein
VAPEGEKRKLRVLPNIPVVIPLGMTGFDSVIHRLCSPRSGMATVPDTHMLHHLSANSVRTLGARFVGAAKKAQDVAASYVSPYALAA